MDKLSGTVCKVVHPETIAVASGRGVLTSEIPVKARQLSLVALAHSHNRLNYENLYRKRWPMSAPYLFLHSGTIQYMSEETAMRVHIASSLRCYSVGDRSLRNHGPMSSS